MDFYSCRSAFKNVYSPLTKKPLFSHFGFAHLDQQESHSYVFIEISIVVQCLIKMDAPLHVTQIDGVPVARIAEWIILKMKSLSYYVYTPPATENKAKLPFSHLLTNLFFGIFIKNCRCIELLNSS